MSTTDFAEMTPAEQIQSVQDLWDRIAAETGDTHSPVRATREELELIARGQAAASGKLLDAREFLCGLRGEG